MRQKPTPSASARTSQGRAPQAKVRPTQRAPRIKGSMTRAPRTKLVAANVQLKVPVSTSLVDEQAAKYNDRQRCGHADRVPMIAPPEIEMDKTVGRIAAQQYSECEDRQARGTRLRRPRRSRHEDGQLKRDRHEHLRHVQRRVGYRVVKTSFHPDECRTSSASWIANRSGKSQNHPAPRCDTGVS